MALPLDDDIKDLIEHETTQAQDVLAGLAAALPRSVDAHWFLGHSHLRRMEFAPALAAYRQVLALDPKHDGALHHVALCLRAMGDHEGALAAYRQAFAVTSSVSAVRAIGLLSHRMGRLDAAVSAYDAVLSRGSVTSSEFPVVLQGMAAVLRDAGKPLAADRQVQALIGRFRRERNAVSSVMVFRNSEDDFPEWSRYVDKATLGAILTRRRAVDPTGRVPETFMLPQQREALAAFAAGPDAPALYIVKPIRGSGGQGISVTDTIADALDCQDVVVQRYLDRPYLVNGRKSHLRIYGLITSVDPLRAYVYADGIVRFAPEPYDPRPGQPGGTSMHVTNTALHLDHPDMKISQDASQEDTGMVWSLSAWLRRIIADGGNGDAMFEEIRSLMTWFVRTLAAEGLFARQAAAGPRRSFPHKLFGLDVLMDADGHPWLIEMQRIPAQTGAPLVNKVNAAMYANMFAMAHGLLTDDDVSLEALAAIRSDPSAMIRRELEIETANRGRFVPLDL